MFSPSFVWVIIWFHFDLRQIIIKQCPSYLSKYFGFFVLCNIHTTKWFGYTAALVRLIKIQGDIKATRPSRPAVLWQQPDALWTKQLSIGRLMDKSSIHKSVSRWAMLETQFLKAFPLVELGLHFRKLGIRHSRKCPFWHELRPV